MVCVWCVRGGVAGLTQKIFTFTSFPPHSMIIICRVIPIARRLRKQDHRTTRFIMVLERRCGVPFVRLRTTGSSDTTTPNTTNATTTPTRSGVTTVMDQRIIDLGRSECNPPFADNSTKTSRFTLLSFFPLVSVLYLLSSGARGTEAIDNGSCYCCGALIIRGRAGGGGLVWTEFDPALSNPIFTSHPNFCPTSQAIRDQFRRFGKFTSYQ